MDEARAHVARTPHIERPPTPKRSARPQP
jgi:hypothetical protein